MPRKTLQDMPLPGTRPETRWGRFACRIGLHAWLYNLLEGRICCRCGNHQHKAHPGGYWYE